MRVDWKKVWFWLPPLVWAALIFGGSTNFLSEQHTSRFLVPFFRWLIPDISNRMLDTLQMIVRKSGHISEYAVLGALFLAALHQRFLPLPRAWSWRRAFLAWLLATGYAASDEFHQSFVPSRTANPRDAMIDAAAAGGALLLLWWLSIRRARRAALEVANAQRVEGQQSWNRKLRP